MDYEKFFVSLSRQIPHISRIVLFGSRARGDFNEKSDFDIAIYGGLNFQDKLLIRDKIEEWHFVYKVDLVFMNELTDDEMRSNIEKDGIVIVNKVQQKTANYANALKRLNEALSVEPADDIVLDAIIQRFEFTVELAWKTMRAVLLDEGVAQDELMSPKQVVRSAFQADLISAGEVWFAMLEARNITSHVYDLAQAEKIVDEIRATFITELEKLEKKLEK
ncbi:hypothetical protein OfM1_13790 [Lactovum odontotermitis]